MTIKRCSKGSIPIVKRFLGENFRVAQALYHVTLSPGVQNNHSYEIFDPYLPIQYSLCHFYASTMTIKRCSKVSIPIVKRFLGENSVPSKMVPKMALFRGNGGLDIRFCVRNPEEAHPWAKPHVLAYFASRSVHGPWL